MEEKHIKRHDGNAERNGFLIGVCAMGRKLKAKMTL
jgi:hypothetical protein